MALCKAMADGHLLLWLVPALAGALLAGLGRRLGRRWLQALALGGVLWPLLQASLAAIDLLWGTPAGTSRSIRFAWMTTDVSTLGWALDLDGVWAILVATSVAFFAQLHALKSVARFAGRHRFHALVLMLTASATFLFTAKPAGVGMLLGWEGLSLTGAFLAGFWALEARGARTGLRWLLFQRLSGLLLLLAFLALEVGSQDALAAVFVVAAVCLRAGQVPFHSFFPDTAKAQAAASALVNGVASLLASVYLLNRFLDLVAMTLPLPRLLAGIGLASVVLGLLSGLQQRSPQKTMGWLFMVQSGLALLSCSVFDPVAAKLLAGGGALVLCGITLAVGSAAGSEVETEVFTGSGGASRARRSFLVLAAVLVLPPSLAFAGPARLMAALPDDLLGWSSRMVVLSAGLGLGFILRRLYRTLAPASAPTAGPSGWWQDLAPAGLGALALILGTGGLLVHQLSLWGGLSGATWAGLFATLAVAGWTLSWAWGRHRPSARWGRLSASERVMDRLAETGLGVGELVVQLPLALARALGVVIWRFLGDVLVDGIILGLAVRTVEGVGLALRYLQNGRVHRYALVAVAAALALLLIMLRE